MAKPMAPGPHAGNRNRPAYSGQPRFRFPKQIVQLFAPRKALDFKPPPRKRQLRSMTGLASFKDKFESSAKSTLDENMTDKFEGGQSKKTGDEFETTDKGEGGQSKKAEGEFETPAQRRRRLKKEKQRKVVDLIAKRRAEWDPFANAPDTEKTKEPYNTLFLSNVPFTTLELSLKEEFEQFGPIRSVVMPKHRDGVPCGYAFIEFENGRDVAIAVRQADGMRFEGRRLKVDVERGRTVKGWLPNRLDGPNNPCAPRRKHY